MFAALINHLWQSTIFAIVVALLILAFRKNRARVRYALWLAASLKFLVPFALLIALGTNLWITLAARKVSTGTAPPVVSQALVQAVQPISDTFFPTHAQPNKTNWLLISIVTAWALGFLAIARMRFRAWLRIRAALKSSQSFEIRHPEWREATRRTSLSFSVRSAPGLLEPGVVGLFRPTLLLPEGILQTLTPPQLEAVVAHELAHIRRRDNLTAALHMLVEAVFWFHPLVWWIGARLIEERERACDEAVLSLGNQPRDYAEAILNVCKLYVESPLACAAGVTGADLKKRIHAILAGHLASELNLAKKCGLAAAGVAALALPILVGLINTPSLRAQSEDQSSLSFEVASIKPAGYHPGSDVHAKGALYDAIVNTSSLIKEAYGVSDYQILDGPDWINSDKYSIDAKIPEVVVTAWRQKYDRAKHEEDMREMIRSLLADRFALKVTHQTKELPVFVLEVARGGAKITPVKDDGTYSSDDGHNEGWVEIEQMKIEPINTLVEVLTRQPEIQGRKVLDQTGLTATYTYTLKWTRQRPLSTNANDESQPTSEAPALEDALENQLGLQLKSTKAPIDTIVISHIEKPTPN